MKKILSALALVVLHHQAISSAEITREQLQFFESRVRPILVNQCYRCHSSEGSSLRGGLYLDTRDGWMQGGTRGQAIVPGQPEKSLLIKAIRHEDKRLKMPKGEKQLSSQQIAVLVRWVEMGAPDPREGPTALIIRREIDLEEGRKFWAFQPPRRPAIPPVRETSWPRGDLDRFILASLEKKGVAPVPDAGRPALIRRATFDLIGLPPSPEEVEDFVNDRRTGAFERVVDRLLESRQFGARWGRHWLDVVRYAESVGMERNFTYPAAWRYRDYVIDSFNRDKPYDQFVREQIAGDLMPSSEDEKIERVIATGFLALGPKSLNERDRNVFLMDVVDEQIDAVTRSFLGVTASCARCHDHKFDPIPTEDYYALAGIFCSTETLYGTVKGGGNRQTSRLLSFGDSDPDLLKEFNKDRDRLTSQIGKEETRLRKLRNTTNPNTRAMAQMTEKINELSARLTELTGNAPGLPDVAMCVQDAEKIEDCRVHIRGNTRTLGDSVNRGYISVMSTDSAPEVDSRQSGRLQLAQWISSRDNPLVARVMVNRIWHHLFGQGLVRTLDNFGASGARPSNPEILDYLAVQFVEHGWSVKKMIRQIVISRAYQLSSDYDSRNYKVDPDNRLGWKMSHRRLSVEAIRDAVLAVAGQIDLTPPRGSIVAEIGDTNVGRSRTLLERIRAGSRHRSVYLPIIRNEVPEMLKVFDFAEPSIIVGRRDVTTVPTQALYMLNSEFMLAQSEHMARRLLERASVGDRDRIDLAYRLAFSRSPTDLERSRAVEFMDECQAEWKTGTGDKNPDQRRIDAWASFCQALLASAEFRYIE